MKHMSEHTGLISSSQLLITDARTNIGSKMNGGCLRAADPCRFVPRNSYVRLPLSWLFWWYENLLAIESQAKKKGKKIFLTSIYIFQATLMQTYARFLWEMLIHCSPMFTKLWSNNDMKNKIHDMSLSGHIWISDGYCFCITIVENIILCQFFLEALSITTAKAIYQYIDLDKYAREQILTA